MNPETFIPGVHPPGSACAGTDVWLLGQPAQRTDPRSESAHDEVAGVLKRYCDGSSPCLVRDSRGRPYLEGDSGLNIGIAHCTGVTLLAVSYDAPVGVDVERRIDRGLRSLPFHALGEHELVALDRVRASERAEAFLTYWVRKEAVLKAAGVGLGVEPALVEVSPPWAEPTVCVVPHDLGPAYEWTLLDLAVPGCAAAVAIRQSAATVHLITLATAM